MKERRWEGGDGDLQYYSEKMLRQDETRVNGANLRDVVWICQWERELLMLRTRIFNSWSWGISTTYSNRVRNDGLWLGRGCSRVIVVFGIKRSGEGAWDSIC